MFRRLGETLTILRILRRLSQSELARRAGIKATQVSRYETGQVQPQLRQLERLLDALEVGLPEFLFTLVHVERTLEILESCRRTPEETLVRDAVTTYWNEVTDLHLRVSQAVEQVIEEEIRKDA